MVGSVCTKPVSSDTRAPVSSKKSSSSAPSSLWKRKRRVRTALPSSELAPNAFCETLVTVQRMRAAWSGASE